MGRNLQLILTEVYEPQCALGVGFFCLIACLAVVSAVESTILCVEEVNNIWMIDIVYLAHRNETRRLDAVSGHVDVFDYFPARMPRVVPYHLDCSLASIGLTLSDVLY